MPILRKREGKLEFGLTRCLERGAGVQSISFQLVTPLLGGATERQDLQEGELVEKVAGLPTADPARARKGTHLKVKIYPGSGGGSF